jgi:hypothetical protein
MLMTEDGPPNLQYDQGEKDTITDCFACYRGAFKIEAGTIKAMDRPFRLGAAEFEIAKPLWMEETWV